MTPERLTIVPFVDVVAQNRSLAAEIEPALAGVIERGDFILGEDVARFEGEFARYCGVDHAVGLDSGVSALELALRAYGIGPGDEVITTTMTFVATVSAVTFAGATPVLTDIDPATCTIDVDAVERAITSRTRAIIPVHLYGQMADMEPLLDVARRRSLRVIEDACQAHGATLNGRRAGSFGDAACFSFYPAKNLGAFGDGGMLVTNDAQIAKRVRMLRNYGQKEKYVHLFPAFNRRLDTLQAAVLRVKLRHLDRWNAWRRDIAAKYDIAFRELDVEMPSVGVGREHVYHLFVVRTRRRDDLQAWLTTQGIASGKHYPVPVHLQPAYAGCGWSTGAFPVAERHALIGLSLPMYPEMRSDQVERVVGAVQQFYGRAAGVEA